MFYFLPVQIRFLCPFLLKNLEAGVQTVLSQACLLCLTSTSLGLIHK